MSTTYVKLGTSYRIPHVYCRPKLDGSNRNAGCSALLLPTEIRYTVSHRRGFPCLLPIHRIELQGVPHLYHRREFDRSNRNAEGHHACYRRKIDTPYRIEGGSPCIEEGSPCILPIHRIASKGVPHVCYRRKFDTQYCIAGGSHFITDENSVHSIALQGIPMSVSNGNSIHRDRNAGSSQFLHRIASEGVPHFCCRYSVSHCRGFPCLLLTKLRYTVSALQGVPHVD